MNSISNNYLSVQIANKGAELQSICHRQHNLEYLWSGDPAVWAKKSPVLFPIIGELKDKKYTYNGKIYNLSRHGFARDMEFEVTEKHENAVTFSIHSNEKTLNVYPFEFVFSVRYTLLENALQVTYIVENKGRETMYFSAGGHPAFKVPLVDGTTYEDYQLVFDQKEILERQLLSSDGLIKKETAPLLKDENVLPLKKELFSSDAIVLQNIKSASVAIRSDKTAHGIKVNFAHFPYLGIWETKGGDFVCIEPWCGIADSADASGRLEEKKGINALKPSGKFEVSFGIEVF